MAEPIVSRDPDVMGGTPVFAGTRAPVQTLLEYLEAGETIDDFLAGFPMVSRDRATRFLEQSEADADAEWSEEIRRRLARLDSGEAKTAPSTKARRRIWIAADRDPD